MKVRLNFVKMAHKWYVQLPNYEGNFEDLEMIMNADMLCDRLDLNGDGLIRTIACTRERDCDETPNVKLEFDRVEEIGGAYYTVSTSNFMFEIWVCDVTKEIFGKFPAELYITVI